MFAFHLQIINFSQFIIQRLKGEECTSGPSFISTICSWWRVDDCHIMSFHKSTWGVWVPEESMYGSFECWITNDWKRLANYEKCLLLSRKCKSKYKLRTVCHLWIWQKLKVNNNHECEGNWAENRYFSTLLVGRELSSASLKVSMGIYMKNVKEYSFTQPIPFGINLLKKRVRQQNRDVCIKMFMILETGNNLLVQK